MYRLHDNMSSGNAYKVRLLLTQLGIPFQRIEYDVDKAETRTPEFLAKNPNGRIPLLELSPGRFLAESNAIAPGVVITEATRTGIPDEMKQMILAMSRSTRLGEPKDIAAMVAMLFSDDGEWINGQVVSVDGGVILRG